MEGTAVSRTDSHAPLRVRLARGDLAASPVHRCQRSGCDLPARPPARWYPGLPETCCYWTFRYTGTAVCPCPMCHGGQDHRAENRRRRHRERVVLAAAARIPKLRSELP